MKPVLWLLATVAVSVPLAHAQMAAPTQTPTTTKVPFDQPQREAPRPAQAFAQQGPAQPPQEFEMPVNGKCQSVRSGDLVHFTLKIDSVQDARAIFTNLELSLGHVKYHAADLPLTGANTLGGGGAAVHDASDPVLYHFSFIIPDDVRTGIYRTFGIAVHADYGAAPGDSLRPVDVPLNRNARKEVQRYCLAVFGGGNGGHSPIVTEFKPGPVERPKYSAPQIP